MRDRVEETVLLLVLVNLSNQKNRVDHYSRDDQCEEYDPENQGNDFPPLEKNPSDIQRDRQSDQAGAKDYENRNFLSTSRNAHRRSLSDHTKRDADKKKPRGKGPAAESVYMRVYSEFRPNLPPLLAEEPWAQGV